MSVNGTITLMVYVTMNVNLKNRCKMEQEKTNVYLTFNDYFIEMTKRVLKKEENGN